MKYNKKLFVFSLLLSILLVICASCSKKKEITKTSPASAESTDLLSIIEKYYKFSTIKPDGKIMFQSNLTNNDPSLINTAVIGGVFYDKDGNVDKSPGKISIGGYQLTPSENGTYGFDKVLPQKGLFGTNVTFTVNKGNSNLAASSRIQNVATATLYSPQPISITNVAPRTPINLVTNTATTITWNADPNNPNGVIIIGEYLPTRYMNKKSLTAGYSKMIESSKQVPDNGSTSIPWSFFSTFPPGGHIILWVARGNYTILANGTYSYQVGGYTAAAVWDVRVPIPPTGFTVTSGSSTYSSTVRSGAGMITAYPGTTVTVKVESRSSATTGTLPTLTCSCGITLSTGSNTLTATNNTVKTATFTMPFSGSVGWNCTFNTSSLGSNVGIFRAY